MVRTATRRKPCRVVLLSLVALSIPACATVGPTVSSDEVRQAKDAMKARVLLGIAPQQERAWRVGRAVFSVLPVRHGAEAVFPEAGLLLIDASRAARHAFDLARKQDGAVVLAVRPDSPAAQGGVQRGDVIMAVDGASCSSTRKVLARIQQRRPGQTCTLQLLRGGHRLDRSLILTERSAPMTVRVVPDSTVNASTDGSEILLTSGMMRFLETDDELAVVLGHEAAHRTEGHLPKTMATNILSSVVGGTLGGLADVAAPGAGPPVANSIGGLAGLGVRRDFEREADYRGLLYAARAGFNASAGVGVWERFALEVPDTLIQSYFSTHPASPERLVRARKIADSIHEIGVDGTIARYERSTSAEE